MVKISDFALGFIITGVALFFFSFGARDAIQENIALRTYVPIDAVVDSSDVKVIPASSSSRSHSPTYRPDIHFHYEVDGHKYASDNGEITKISIGYKSPVQQTVDRYQPGQHYIAYYDPKNPAKAFLVREPSFAPYMIILFSMTFLTFGVAMLAYPILQARWSEENRLLGSETFILERTKRREFYCYLAISIFWFGIGGFALLNYFSIAKDSMQMMQFVTTLMYCGFGLLPLKAAISSFRLCRQARKQLKHHF